MKTLLLAAALASLVGMSQARADELYVLSRTAPYGSEWVCGLSPYSLPDLFRRFSQYNASVGYPQPQIDYATGAPIHATVIHTYEYPSGAPKIMIFFTKQDYCKNAAISANKVGAQ
jgi:hypothetical protein